MELFIQQISFFLWVFQKKHTAVKMREGGAVFLLRLLQNRLSDVGVREGSDCSSLVGGVTQILK